LNVSISLINITITTYLVGHLRIDRKQLQESY
jgi:flagellar capping protein FliD